MRSVVFRTATAAIFLLFGGLPDQALAQQAASAWDTQCLSRTRADAGICTASHRVTVQETGQTLFVFEVRTRPDMNAPDILVTGPTGFYLPDGIKLAVDGRVELGLIIDRCDQNGCNARAELPDDFIAAMKAGDRLAITFSPTRNNSRTFELPLIGFADAYAVIEL